MSELFREPGRGEDILTAFKRLMQFVRKERVVAGDGIIIKQTEGGKTISAVRRRSAGTGDSYDPTDPSTPGGDIAALGHVYSFETWANAAKDGIEMIPGDVWFGPMTVVHWADFTGESTTPPVSSTDACVWLEVDVTSGSEAVEMKYGSRAAMESALDSAEQLTKMVVPLVETTWADGVITRVKNLHPGDVLIPRAAG